MKNIELKTRLMSLADMVADNPALYGPLSTGERIAVAMILDRADLLKKDSWTMLKAVDRLGPEWTAAALEVQRER